LRRRVVSRMATLASISGSPEFPLDMNLQPLFADPILEQVYLDPGYSGHASDVWRVRTTSEAVVVRAFRWADYDQKGPFWGGLGSFFGIDPARIFDLEPLNDLLCRVSPVPAPRVLRKATLESRDCIVVELMPGAPPATLLGAPKPLLEQLGRMLATIHAHHFAWYGHPAGQTRHDLVSFPGRLAATMRDLVERFYPDDAKIRASLDRMISGVLTLPVPNSCSLIMIDIDPSQYLADGGRLTAIVDTEAFVVGPPAMELLALEYVLDPTGAEAVARGYRSLSPLPPLAAVRPVYRYFLRLIEVQGDDDLDEWMSWPILFANTEMEKRKA
jgi:hypothetical protein